MEIVSEAQEYVRQVKSEQEIVGEIQAKEDAEYVQKSLYGIAVVVLDEVEKMVEEDSGEILGYHGKIQHREILYNPETVAEKQPWLSWEDAWKKIADEYEYRDAEQYLTDYTPSDSEFVIIRPIDEIGLDSVMR